MRVNDVSFGLFSIGSFKTRSMIRSQRSREFLNKLPHPQVLSLLCRTHCVSRPSLQASPMPRDEAAQLIRFNPISRKSPRMSSRRVFHPQRHIFSSWSRLVHVRHEYVRSMIVSFCDVIHSKIILDSTACGLLKLCSVTFFYFYIFIHFFPVAPLKMGPKWLSWNERKM